MPFLDDNSNRRMDIFRCAMKDTQRATMDLARGVTQHNTTQHNTIYQPNLSTHPINPP